MNVAARTALVAAALALTAGAARAKVSGTTADGVYRFPSGDIPDVARLKSAVQTPSVKAIVVAKGTYDVGTTPLFVAARDDLVICGATGNPKDVTFTASNSSVVFVQEARNITLRGLTLTTTASFGAAVYLNATPSSERDSYAQDVTVERCTLSGYEGLAASVGVENLTVDRCRVVVTATNGEGGAGILWGDGAGLFVAKTTFAASSGTPAVAGVFVQGAQASGATGGRASRIVLSGNSVSGDFARGFDLGDVTDARVRGNRVSFGTATTTHALSSIPAGSGRMGIIVRRANASSPTEDFELFGNRVRGAYYGAWIVNTGAGIVRANDLRRCGSSTLDPQFQDHGGALRLNLQSGVCRLTIEKNDCRALRTPAAEPAVSVVPAGAEGVCFPTTGGNRVDKNRLLYLGETP